MKRQTKNFIDCVNCRLPRNPQDRGVPSNKACKKQRWIDAVTSSGRGSGRSLPPSAKYWAMSRRIVISPRDKRTYSQGKCEHNWADQSSLSDLLAGVSLYFLSAGGAVPLDRWGVRPSLPPFPSLHLHPGGNAQVPDVWCLSFYWQVECLLWICVGVLSWTPAGGHPCQVRCHFMSQQNRSSHTVHVGWGRARCTLQCSFWREHMLRIEIVFCYVWIATYCVACEAGHNSRGGGCPDARSTEQEPGGSGWWKTRRWRVVLLTNCVF